jgi:3-methyladenine DNA glycosylase/8-oxoguanine DNA glycosylase
MHARTFDIEGPLDLGRTLFPLCRGRGDPVMRLDGVVAWRAMRTPDGPATIRLAQTAGSRVEALAWGPGADWALDRAPASVGALDDTSGFEPHHAVLARAWRRYRGVRITRTFDVLAPLLAAVCEQKVTGLEARRSWRGLVRATSEPAPGPGDLLLPPDPARVARLPSYRFHPFGIERRRAEVLQGLAARAGRISKLADQPLDAAKAWLALLPGVGGWTVAEVARLALGDADAVSVGDYHVPNLVAWALAHEPRATDERMLELLEPYRGHRGRVQRLLEAAGMRAPAFGPRTEIRSIVRI